MRTPRTFFPLLLILFLTWAGANVAAQGAHSGKIVRVSGDAQQATLTNPSAAAVVPAPNQPVLEGAVIETRAGVEIFVETFPGAVATIRENSAVRFTSLRLVAVGADAGRRSAELELQRGSVISTLDPAKQAITKYGIKTPRGVAAARGTVYSVSVLPAAVGGDTSAVLVFSGIVAIDRGSGNPPITIPFGQGAIDAEEEASLLAALISRTPGLAADVLAAVGIVAANVASATSAAGSADNAARLLASVTSAAVRALPGQAPGIVQTMVGAIVARGSATGGSQQAILGAVSGVTDAAVRAVIAAGGGLSQAGAAARAAAHGFVQGRVTGAIDAARLANPGASPAQLLAAANQAAGGEGVAGALSVIGNVATSTALRMFGQSGDASGAATTGAGVGQAASSGAAGGGQAALVGAGLSGTIPGFAPPSVNVQVNFAPGQGLTTVAAGTGPTTSTSSWTGPGHDPVSTLTNAPGGTTTTVVPPMPPAKPGGGGSGSGGGPPAQPQNVTPLLPLNPAINVSPSES